MKEKVIGKRGLLVWKVYYFDKFWFFLFCSIGLEKVRLYMKNVFLIYGLRMKLIIGGCRIIKLVGEERREE